jgi:ABC-type amino acid transport substrate-binding protein
MTFFTFKKGLIGMKKLFLGISLIGLLCVSLFISNAAAGTYTILTEDYPPFNYTEDGNLTGLSTEVMFEILNRVKHPKEIKVKLWSEAYEQTMKNSNCILYSMTRTKERQDSFKWVGPVAPNRVVFYKKKGSDLKIKTLDDARKVGKIGTYKDSASDQFLKQEGFTNIVSAASDDENASKLFSGEIDLWIVGELTGIHKAKASGNDPAGLEKALDVIETQLYIAFNKETPDEEIAKWQKVLDEMKKTGIYKKIMSKYL